MIKVLFFASIRDRIGCSELEIALPADVRNVAAFTELVKQQEKSFKVVLSEPNVMIALNQEMANPEMTIEDGDEIAYFPPVTGG